MTSDEEKLVTEVVELVVSSTKLDFRDGKDVSELAVVVVALFGGIENVIDTSIVVVGSVTEVAVIETGLIADEIELGAMSSKDVLEVDNVSLVVAVAVYTTERSEDDSSWETELEMLTVVSSVLDSLDEVDVRVSERSAELELAIEVVSNPTVVTSG